MDRKKTISAVASGFLLTAAFPRTEIGLLAWFALVPLLVALRDARPKEAFVIGFTAGMAHYLTLVYWLAYTMRIYGNISIWLSVFLLLLFSGYLALYPALFSAILARVNPGPAAGFILIPAIWVSLEYARSFIFTGFPWGLLGYTQYRNLPVIQIADLTGVYGVSFLILLANAAVLFLYLKSSGGTWRGVRPSGRTAGAVSTAAVSIFALALGYGYSRLGTFSGKIDAAPSARVAVAQGNIPQSVKWDAEFKTFTIRKYLRLSLASGPERPELIIWPEAATPFYFLQDERPLTRQILKTIEGMGTPFLIGAPSYARRENGADYFNSAYLVRADGRTSEKYDKAHLVPYGEYVPLKSWFPFIGKMVEHVGDFVPGPPGKTLAWGSSKIGVQICYEIIFPELSRAMAKNGANLLVNLTNDAWYGRTSAPFQHFSKAVFRAVENRRALVRSANTGISGFIQPTGKVMEETPLFEEAVTTRAVPLLSEASFYTRYGDLLPLACLAGILIPGLIRYIRKHRRIA